jgi:hypothetical protein
MRLFLYGSTQLLLPACRTQRHAERLSTCDRSVAPQQQHILNFIAGALTTVSVHTHTVYRLNRLELARKAPEEPVTSVFL